MTTHRRSPASFGPKAHERTASRASVIVLSLAVLCAATLSAEAAEAGPASNPAKPQPLAPPRHKPPGSRAARAADKLETPCGTSNEALKAANDAEADAQLDLDEAERRLELAQKAQETAVAELTDRPAAAATQDAVAARSQAVLDAATNREKANEQLALKKARAACVQSAHAAARRFVHGFGLALSGAYAGDHTERFGAALRYIHPYGDATTWEAVLGFSRFRLSNEADDRDRLLSLLYRWSFGRDSVVFSLGGGLGWLSQEFDRVREVRNYAVLGELSVAFRMDHKCAPSGPCVVPWADLRPFMQSWLPLDGSPVAILFGLELGVNIGFQRDRSPAAKAPAP